MTRLRRAASQDDLIYSVCQKTGLDWDQAQALVEQVRDEHLDEIETSQGPMKSLLSLVFFVVGVALTVAPVIYLGMMVDITHTILAFFSGEPGADFEALIRLLYYRCVLLSWFQLPSIIGTSLAGLAIIYANLRYVRGNWIAALRNL